MVAYAFVYINFNGNGSSLYPKNGTAVNFYKHKLVVIGGVKVQTITQKRNLAAGFGIKRKFPLSLCGNFHKTNQKPIMKKLYSFSVRKPLIFPFVDTNVAPFDYRIYNFRRVPKVRR